MEPPQQITSDVKLGKNVRIYGYVNLYGCEIDDETRIGNFVEIQKGVRVGKRCKISSHSFLCEGVTIEDEVFIGHNVTFINDLYPRSTNADLAVIRQPTPDPTLDAVVRDLPRALAGVVAPTATPTPPPVVARKPPPVAPVSTPRPTPRPPAATPTRTRR